MEGGWIARRNESFLVTLLSCHYARRFKRYAAANDRRDAVLSHVGLHDARAAQGCRSLRARGRCLEPHLHVSFTTTSRFRNMARFYSMSVQPTLFSVAPVELRCAGQGNRPQLVKYVNLQKPDLLMACWLFSSVPMH
jgi:hypothetical protein